MHSVDIGASCPRLSRARMARSEVAGLKDRVRLNILTSFVLFSDASPPNGYIERNRKLQRDV